MEASLADACRLNKMATVDAYGSVAKGFSPVLFPDRFL